MKQFFQNKRQVIVAIILLVVATVLALFNKDSLSLWIWIVAVLIGMLASQIEYNSMIVRTMKLSDKQHLEEVEQLTSDTRPYPGYVLVIKHKSTGLELYSSPAVTEQSHLISLGSRIQGGVYNHSGFGNKKFEEPWMGYLEYEIRCKGVDVEDLLILDWEQELQYNNYFDDIVEAVYNKIMSLDLQKRSTAINPTDKMLMEAILAQSAKLTEENQELQKTIDTLLGHNEEV